MSAGDSKMKSAVTLHVGPPAAIRWENDPEERPAFEIYVGAPGALGTHCFRIFRSGRIEGFPDGAVVINRIPVLEKIARAEGRVYATELTAEDTVAPPPCDGCKHLLKHAQRGGQPWCMAGKSETVNWVAGESLVAHVPTLLSTMRGKDGACGRGAKLREPA
jgi:hypothetical protein